MGLSTRGSSRVTTMSLTRGRRWRARVAVVSFIAVLMAAVGITAPADAATAQTITFGAISGRTLAQSPFTVSATSSASLPVTFSTTTPTVCNAGGADGSTITLLAVGTCTVQADQPGDQGIDPATAVTRSFAVT